MFVVDVRLVKMGSVGLDEMLVVILGCPLYTPLPLPHLHPSLLGMLFSEFSLALQYRFK